MSASLLTAALLLWSAAGFWFGVAVYRVRVGLVTAVGILVLSGPLMWLLVLTAVSRNLFGPEDAGHGKEGR